MDKRFWVYMVTDKPYGTLYAGVSSDLCRRAYEHRAGIYKGFSKRYGLKMLVYYEEYPTALEGIAREKQIKAWNRAWKIELIERSNPYWNAIYSGIVG